MCVCVLVGGWVGVRACVCARLTNCGSNGAHVWKCIITPSAVKHTYSWIEVFVWVFYEHLISLTHSFISMLSFVQITSILVNLLCVRISYIHSFIDLFIPVVTLTGRKTPSYLLTYTRCHRALYSIAAAEPVSYRWRELLQVLFLSRQKTCFVATKICLPRQKFWRK